MWQASAHYIPTLCHEGRCDEADGNDAAKPPQSYDINFAQVDVRQPFSHPNGNHSRDLHDMLHNWIRHRQAPLTSPTCLVVLMLCTEAIY